jgi:sec-independent protein translocase protein TatA
MPNVGPLELAIVLIIALVIFGPKRLPELGRSVGKGIREFRSSISGKGGDDDDDDEKPEIESGSKPAEPVEGEVVTDHRS